jgi:hypothetical protein
VRHRPLPDSAKLHASVRDRRAALASYLPKLTNSEAAERWVDADWTTARRP